MKAVMKHFIPNQFKKQKELIFKKNSFNKVMTGYVILLMFFLIILFTIGGEANYKKNQVFMYSQIIYNIVIICINGICSTQFHKRKLQKYLVFVVYFSSVLGIFSGIALVALITERPFHNFMLGTILIWIGWSLEMFIHGVLVWWALKRNNLKLRDRYTNYFSNLIGIVGIVLAGMAYITENENLIFLSTILIVIVVIFFVTFDFQRVQQYWKKEPDQDTNISIYGDSIKMMKNKK
ncbi:MULTISPECIES: hypothetical protein [unclassified Enterococcus]|uniref:hypothetical protein n=1 Tax=unclassified Enterococcus TaxID=2608891 RepID=UPI0013EB2CE2|nr:MULTISPECIES: hypothetical protein [unclassified Enterococcus]